MTRIPRPTPDELDEQQKRLHAAVTGGDRANGPQLFRLADDDGRLEGPFNAMLLNPAVGDALQRLGAAIRYEGRLSDRCREIAILAVAAHWQSGFEQRAHEPIGAHVGLAATELDSLRNGDPVELDDPDEAAVLRTTRHLLQHLDLDDDAYRAAAEALGHDKLFELTTLIGYYSTLALQMRVFAVH
ncbi:carboxymuconolactone decarboxylase family protein [Actinobacteria bacterium YIM 96077]|uniref:Carboxymuconolactone decarboxylase family protein n=1 Tax=Phytoactinopolyspora halophila TaxID=1981511 RepID=A0A329QF87_9ACTN|nr:carboxymuconolactone decarboxylase family protein [Phytoactinopolyspora halophila]AYY14063.1 carboxymuconolactone decarboxylase family protein [Actinobacteria bacterium YIM 96077]RAW10970.1 carboxymuconolactone decarboxylase family protein [Phytoactinopolyspora halophila]